MGWRLDSAESSWHRNAGAAAAVWCRSEIFSAGQTFETFDGRHGHGPRTGVRVDPGEHPGGRCARQRTCVREGLLLRRGHIVCWGGCHHRRCHPFGCGLVGGGGALSGPRSSRATPQHGTQHKACVVISFLPQTHLRRYIQPPQPTLPEPRCPHSHLRHHISVVHALNHTTCPRRVHVTDEQLNVLDAPLDRRRSAPPQLRIHSVCSTHSAPYSANSCQPGLALPT